MQLTPLAQRLKEARDNNLPLDSELEVLATCMGSEGVDYALFEGGYLKPEDWIAGKDLARLQEAIEVFSEFREIVGMLHEEF